MAPEELMTNKAAKRFDFPKLESLRVLCRQIQQDQKASLAYFSSGVGFKHVRGKGDDDISVSSSATCIISLMATGQWTATQADSTQLLKYLLSRNTSAKLDSDNPFTTAWILEAVTVFETQRPDLYIADALDEAEIKRKEQVLLAEVENGKGGIQMGTYPASGYLTQLVVRVLQRRRKLPPNVAKQVRDWAWDELAKQLALVHANSKTQDAFAVAYSLILVTAVTPASAITPEEASIQRAALKTVFECQLKDGTWPLSRPLFHYPGFGNAYCYEYEMLTQLLHEAGLRDLLFGYIRQLGIAAKQVLHSIYRVRGGVPAWTSGHHPNQPEPESWATASVYHFVHELDRLLAEAVRRELFRSLELPFPRPGLALSKETDFATNFLDSNLEIDGETRSLKKFLWQNFVAPLSKESPEVAKGFALGDGTPRSAIFFGPPGTSKTEYAKEVARFLGWPHLAVDPSHFLRSGMDNIQAEANNIFRILGETERVVVLFDEFDEFVRERGAADVEPFSRLLTTAMLPKLASIHKRGTLVFIIATNNIGEFDLAIRRRGRFDHVLQIMPPTCEEKLNKDGWGQRKVNLRDKFDELGVTLSKKMQQQLGELTFGECEAFVAAVSDVTTKEEAITLLTRAAQGCTLRSPVSKVDKTTWAKRCKSEIQFNQ